MGLFLLGFFIGVIIMWVVAKNISILNQKEVEKLKDFETWKEWKNKSE